MSPERALTTNTRSTPPEGTPGIDVEPGQIEAPLAKYERVKGGEIIDKISSMIADRQDIPTEDMAMLEAIPTRIGMVIESRETEIARMADEKGIDIGGATAADDVVNLPTAFRLQRTTIPLITEVGEGGSRYVRPDGSRDWIAKTPEKAALPSYQYKDMKDVVAQKGGEVMSGGLTDSTKTTLFEALGVIKPGQTIEDAARSSLESDGKSFWGKEYTAVLPTSIDGVFARVDYKDSSRDFGGVTGRTFDVDLIIPHNSGTDYPASKKAA